MNEKIKELAKKSGATFLQSSDGKVEYVDYNQTFFDMFEYANTIIQECISVIEPDDHPVDEINYRYAIISEIKRHFGIEDED